VVSYDIVERQIVRLKGISCISFSAVYDLTHERFGFGDESLNL
jgi:hypothetical protein